MRGEADGMLDRLGEGAETRRVHPGELVLALHREVVELARRLCEERQRDAATTNALLKEMAQLRDLLAERVQRAEPEWMTAADAARRLSMSPAAVYADMARNPDGLLAQAATRLGRRIRFSRAGVDRVLSMRTPLRQRAPRAVVEARAPSPGKGTERW